MKKLEVNFPSAKRRVLIICGVHGNEHYSIKTCWHLYQQMDAAAREGKESKLNFTFLFNVNETGIHYCEREYVEETNPGNKDFNRAFANKPRSFEDIVEDVKKEICGFADPKRSYNLVIDVHNSMFCAPCALVDYNVKQFRMYEFLKTFNLNPVCLPSSNKGTIKRFAYTVGIPAVTLECGPMELLGDDNDTYLRYILKLLQAFTANEDLVSDTRSSLKEFDKWTVAMPPSVVETPLLTPYEGVIEWERNDAVGIQGHYKEGDVICSVCKISDDPRNKWMIIAPKNLTIIDVVSSTYAFEGDTLFNYVED